MGWDEGTGDLVICTESSNWPLECLCLSFQPTAKEWNIPGEVSLSTLTPYSPQYI